MGEKRDQCAVRSIPHALARMAQAALAAGLSGFFIGEQSRQLGLFFGQQSHQGAPFVRANPVAQQLLKMLDVVSGDEPVHRIAVKLRKSDPGRITPIPARSQYSIATPDVGTFC